MSKNKKEIPNWVLTGHRKPVTRREFLNYGIIPFAASTFMPNWLSLLAPNGAMAQSAANCPSDTASSMIPFIQLNLSGGAGLMANYVPMDAGMNLLPTYQSIGLGNGQVPIEREFGNVPFAGQGISNVLTGIRARANAATIGKTAFIGMCVRSQNDTDANPFAMNGLAHRAGLVGTKLPHLGTQNSQGGTGIGQMPVLYAPPSPLIVRGFSDVANSLGYTAGIATGLNPAQRERLTKLVSDLNGSQARKLASITTGAEVNTLIECAGIKNVDLVRQGAGAVDPRTNAAVAAAWQVNAQTANNNQNLVFGTMVYNTLIGQAGSASLNIGGYDYHNNPRATTNARDNAAGQVIGNILQTAEILQRPLFLFVTSDGSVSSVNSADRQSMFNGDNSASGMAYIIMYQPTGRIATTGFQIGHFTSAQAAATDTVVGNSPNLATQAAFANYCKMNNRMDLYSRIVTTGLNDTARINEVVKVG